MAKKINHILIIGGGTAGWLSAAILAKSLDSLASEGVQVTLVESPDIPILGVGEGTWPNLRATFQKIGISETEFLRECDATFKQGAEFVNWCTAKDNQKEHSYYHPLSTVSHSSYNFSLAPYWLQQQTKTRLSYDLSVASQVRLCKQGIAPKQIVTPEYDAIEEYAYHLDANKLALFLKKHCINNLGVKYISANVTAVNLDEDNFIESVSLDHCTKKQLNAGFFVDCSGSKGLIIKETYHADWVSTDNIIFNDTALAVQVPYNSSVRPIKTHTVATAQSAGWIWDIGLQQRRGVGHVYSSRYISEEQATKELQRYIGPDWEPNLTVRKINLNLGYHKKIWNKNSVAIGMSSGFVEPLEASAIFLLDAAANMVASQFPRSREQIPYVEKKFNQYMNMRMQRTVEFIKLHYCISDRKDTPYWVDNCDPKTIPENLKERLSYWRSQPPTKYDFENSWEPFNLDSYLYVLYGMNFDTQVESFARKFTEYDKAEQLFKKVVDSCQYMSKKLPKQRELIEKVIEYGFSKI